jgi:hypothetical protein
MNLVNYNLFSMKREQPQSYKIVQQLREKLLAEGKIIGKKKHYTSLLGGTLEDVNAYEIVTEGDYSYVNSETFQDLSTGGKLLVIQIMIELKLNSVLWQFDPSLKPKIIKELKTRKILFRTETTGIFVVNPFFIRKGRIDTALNCTLYFLEDPAKVTTDHIIEVKSPRKLKLSGLKYLGV